MDIKNIVFEWVRGAKFVEHFSGGYLLRTSDGYLANTFLSTKALFVMKAGVTVFAGATFLVGALALYLWKPNLFKSIAAFAWEGMCNLYEATSELCTSTLDAAWHWLGFEDGPEQPA